MIYTLYYRDMTKTYPFTDYFTWFLFDYAIPCGRNGWFAVPRLNESMLTK
jgi:hypothetical protein